MAKSCAADLGALKGFNNAKFYIDTANVDEIRKANDMGIIAGVTTNPSLIAKEGRNYAETLAEISTIVDGPHLRRGQGYDG